MNTNKKYDIVSGSPSGTRKCKHVFEDIEPRTEYHDYFCDLVIEHGREGYYIEGFCGRYNISADAMSKWLDACNSQFVKFRDAVKISISAALHYWNEEYNYALDHFETDGDKLPHIKNILTDIMKYTPKILREMQFQGVKSSAEAEKDQQARIQDEFLGAIQGEK